MAPHAEEEVQFLHVTSTAGTAIEQWALRQLGIRWGHENRALREPAWGLLSFGGATWGRAERWHMPPALLLASDHRHKMPCISCAASADPSRRGPPYNGTHVFCVTRHPVCRCVSEFRSVSSKPPHAWANGTFATWDAWLNASLRRVGGTAPSLAHNLPVVPWYSCDTYLRFEHLQADFTRFVRRRWPSLTPEQTVLPTFRHSRNLPYNVTSAQLHAIASVFAADMRAFGYTLRDIPCSLTSGPGGGAA